MIDIHVPSPWESIVLLGCTHGHLQDPLLCEQALVFIEKYKPVHRVHLGDALDTTAFRSGAPGTPDEREDPVKDLNHAAEFFKRMEPTVFTRGNHDARLEDAMNSTSGLVAACARHIWEEVVASLPKQCKITPYDIEYNWVRMGAHLVGHGFMYGVNATRDHAEMLGSPAIVAHTHRPEEVRARTLNQGISYNVGTLSGIRGMGYARRRRATLQWGHGLVYGYVDNQNHRSQLWLAQSAPGDLLPLPAV